MVLSGDNTDEAAEDWRCYHYADLQGGLVCAVLDDLVIALYVTVDELRGKRLGPGRPPRLSDAELVCLAVAQVLLGCNSERRWRRFVGHRLGHLFPYVPGQSGDNRRLRSAAPALRLAAEHLARTAPSWWDQWRLLDATPVPCGASQETVKRSALVEWASYGWDRSHSRWYWGCKLYLLAAPDGMPVSWWLASPSWASARSLPSCWGWQASRGCCGRGSSSPLTRAWPAASSRAGWPGWARCWSAPTAATSRTGTGRLVGSASGSSRSST